MIEIGSIQNREKERDKKETEKRKTEKERDL